MALRGVVILNLWAGRPDSSLLNPLVLAGVKDEILEDLKQP